MSAGPSGATGAAASNGATAPTGAVATHSGCGTAAVTPSNSGPQAPPKFLRPNFETMPAELKPLKNWLLWAPTWNGSKWTKRPIQPSGYGASTTNPKHWTSFDDAKQGYERAVERGFIELREKDKPTQRAAIGGVGFVFDGQLDEEGLAFAGVDFDGVISADYKEIHSLAAERVKRLRSYCERSVSGRGLHVIVKARPLSAGVAHAGVEMYTKGRFFTMTGAPRIAPIAAAPDEFAALAKELEGQIKSSRSSKKDPPSSNGGQKSDTDVNAWFDNLPPERQSEVIKYAALHVAKNSKLFELTAHGGNYQQYLKLALAIARSGAPDAEDIFVEAASIAKEADSDEELRKFFEDCERAGPRIDGVTIGTLLHLAQQHGGNFDLWKRQLQWSVPVLSPETRKPLHGGKYSRDEVLELINSHYLIGKSEQEVSIFRIKDDGLLAFTPSEQFKLDVANIFVRLSSKSVQSVEKFWREHPLRHVRRIVFKPGGDTEPNEFNLWRGFGVEPRKGWQKQRRLLRHIRKVICRGDKAKFKYLTRWLAWAVQNPDEHPGVVIVLKSRRQGTGKSTLGVVMLKIYGQHGALIDDSDRLLGRFNDWIESVSFILAEEILWARDYKTADKLKSRTTSDTFQIERKNGGIRQIPNRLHLMMTTNHDHAVAAGSGDRRLVVYDVSEEHACDGTWFEPLYRDLEDGGTNEFLYFLQDLRLGDWHPRKIVKTAETAEQQRMSGDSISQWSQACIYADLIIGTQFPSHELEQTIPSEDLREAYAGYCRQHGAHPVSETAFGKACVEMFGHRKRLRQIGGAGHTMTVFGPSAEAGLVIEHRIEAAPAAVGGRQAEPAQIAQKKRRPWGYDVPDGDKWQEKIDARLGIKK